LSLVLAKEHSIINIDNGNNDLFKVLADKETSIVTTLIPNEYQQSSKSSVQVFKFEVLRRLRMPIARYCLSVELVRVRSSIDS
jgi:hypothetical protein